MNRDILASLSLSDLKEISHRLIIGTSQLSDLLSSLEEEGQELESTKDMLLRTLGEIAPKEENLMAKVIQRLRESGRTSGKSKRAVKIKKNGIKS